MFVLKRVSAALGLAASIAVLSVAYALSHPPVEAFGSLPEITDPELSPDGKHFAVIQSAGGHPVAAIYEVDAPAGSKPAAIPSSDWLIRGLAWAKNDRLILIISNTRKLAGDSKNLLRTFYRSDSVDLNGENDIALLAQNPSFMNNVTIARISDLGIDDPDNVYMPIYEYADTYSPAEEATRSKLGKSDEDLFRYDMMRVNVRTGKGSFVLGGTPKTESWFMDGHGKVVARVDRTSVPGTDHLLIYTNDSWSELKSYPVVTDDGAGIIGLAQNGKGIARLALANGYRVITSIDLASGKESLFLDAPKYDVTEAIYDQWTGRVVGASYVADRPQYLFADEKWQNLQNGLEGAFPGKNVAIASTDMAADKVIVVVEGPRTPPTYYYLDRTTHQASEIGAAYPGISEADLGEMKPYPYKARDGLDIHAYITLPPGKAPKNLPAIVMPHGGPDSRDAMVFDWWAAFLANRGYVVLQPNYRGSSGYGRAFTEAGLKQWGLKMQDDISDGVKKMIADGIVDPKRICIVGASYGGYAALAGATLTPDLYACTVSVAGISDLPRMLARTSQRYGKDSGPYAFWKSRIGTRDDDSDQLRATSPDRHADQVRAPVLLIHGEDDTTVPIEQSELMEDALKSAGKDVSFVRLPGDDHYMGQAASRIAMLKAVESFLAAHIGT